MPAEAAFRVTVKDAKNNLCTVGGDSYAEFESNLTELLGHDAADAFLDGYRAAFGGAPSAGVVPSMQQAEATVIQAFPQAAPVPQPVPQPQPVAAAPSGPSCQHGPMKYKESETKRGTWKRYECSIPWRPNADNSARCSSVNV